MRWLLALIPFPLAACSNMPTIAEPWEPSETQAKPARPVTAADPARNRIGTPVAAADPAWSRIGTSIRGEPIEATTLGSGPKRIYILGGIHGDEPEGPAAAAQLPAGLLPGITSETGEAATVRIVRDMNPDGTASNSKGNTRGIDLNRNFATRDYRPDSFPGSSPGRRAASELEVATIQSDLGAFKPDLVIVLRTAAAGRGPAVSCLDRSKAAAYEFTAGARSAEPKWLVNRSEMSVTPGSFESYVSSDRGIPILSVAFRRGSDASENAKALWAGLLALAAASPRAQAPAP
jgi:predicted deacylase